MRRIGLMLAGLLVSGAACSAQDAAPAPGIFPAGGQLHHLEIRLQAV